jgi:hypothetical protein
LVHVYRIHRMPFDEDAPLRGAGIVTEFGLVRVLIAHMDLPYPELQLELVPEPSGNVQPNAGLREWHSTGDGMVLCLMTPMITGGIEESNVEAPAFRRLALVRAALVSVLGRTVAWEKLSEFTITLSNRGISLTSGAIENPGVYDPPDVSEDSLALTKEILETILSLELETRNRVELALRWYERALAERPVFQTNGISADELISYWIALEVLVSAEEKKAVGAVRFTLLWPSAAEIR